MSIESLMPSSHLILCCPLLLLPSIFPTIRVFSNELALDIRWPKYWSFSFTISSSNEYSEMISFRMDWLDLLAVQGTLKSLFQHHSSKASIFGTQPSLWSNSHIHTWLLEVHCNSWLSAATALPFQRWESWGIEKPSDLWLRCCDSSTSQSPPLSLPWGVEGGGSLFIQHKLNDNLCSLRRSRPRIYHGLCSCSRWNLFCI